MATGYIMLDTARPDPQQGGYPRRGGYRPSGTCIVHTTEGDWRRGVQALINLVLVRADYGCYHRACDWADIALLYPWLWETWQDSETNNWAVGIAAACKTSDWGNMPADVEEGFYRNMARMAADFVVYMRDEYGVTVPLRRISGAEARARVPGFCAHGDSGIARSDPGANFDWARFFRYTQQALDNQEDELSAADVEAIAAAINNAFGRIERELPGAVAKAVKDAFTVEHRDPKTAEPDGQTTSLGTVVAFRDFQDEATRRVVAETGKAVLEAIQALQAGGGAEAAYSEFLEKLAKLQITITPPAT